VRAVETITADVMIFSLDKFLSGLVKCLTSSGQLGEQRSGLPEGGIVERILGKTCHGFHHVEQSFLICVVHRAASINRETVTRDVDHVDIAGFVGNALFQNVSSFVNKRTSLGITARKIGDEEIVQRLVYALVNEAAYILEEGIANKASDIDMIYISGYGFPIYRGGPMHYADQKGLFNVVETMARFAKNPLDDAAFWKPAPLLAKLAAAGKTFN